MAKAHLCHFKFHTVILKPYIVPVVQPWQEDASSSVNVFALSDHHVGGGSQQAYRRSEGEGVQQPQLNGKVVGAAFRQRSRHQSKMIMSLWPVSGVRVQAYLHTGQGGSQ